MLKAASVASHAIGLQPSLLVRDRGLLHLMFSVDSKNQLVMWGSKLEPPMFDTSFHGIPSPKKVPKPRA